MANIFFNYRHDGKDNERAKNIIRGLTEHRHSVFTDLGQNWREEIVPILIGCDGVVVLLTSDSLRHHWTVLEWSIAYGISLVYKHLKLFPVVLDEQAKKELPAAFEYAGDPIEALTLSDDQIVNEIDSKITPLAGRKIMIFISHAHADEDLAEALVGVITSAFEIPNESIRCTSVLGYKLRAGAHTASQLREEIGQTEFVLGIITPQSIESKYVLLELGAAWGLGKRTVPLVARGVKASRIPGPLGELNCLDLAESQNCHQLIDDLSTFKRMGDKKHAMVAAAVEKLAACAQQKTNPP